MPDRRFFELNRCLRVHSVPLSCSIRHFRVFRSNSEHRRQYRRSAAKDRRDKESVLLEELKKAMPLAVEETAGSIDRMSLIRLAVTLTRLRNCVPKRKIGATHYSLYFRVGSENNTNVLLISDVSPTVTNLFCPIPSLFCYQPKIT